METTTSSDHVTDFVLPDAPTHVVVGEVAVSTEPTETTLHVSRPSAPKTRRTNNAPAIKTSVPPVVPTCHYCKEAGHVIRSCPRVICRRCERRGHIADDCDTPQCSECNRFGHTADACWLCERCGRRGHLAETCYTEICESCGKVGHATDACYGPRRCLRCLKRGHIASECRSAPWCYFCSEEHYVGECATLAAYQCPVCGKLGHTTERCSSVSFGRR